MTGSVIDLNRPRATESEDLLKDGALLIDHGDAVYLLRACPKGGLQLTRWTGPLPPATQAGAGKARKGEPRRLGLYGKVWLGD